MALSVQTRTVTYNGDGATISWPIPFPYADAAHIFLYRTDPGGPVLGSAASQVSTASYGASAPGQSGTLFYGSGNPLPVGSSILIARLVPYTQLVALTNQDGYFPDVIEGSLDLLVEMGQQLRDEETALDTRLTADEVTLTALGIEVAADTAAVQIHAAELARALLVADGGQGVIPAAGARANHVLGFDSQGAAALYVGDDMSTDVVTPIGGTVGRTLAAWVSDEVNVLGFGALFNGLADDTAGILAALAYARSLGGGTVVLPGKASTGLISATLPLDFDNVRLVGQGRGGYHDTNPLAPAATTLQWTGADGGVMVRVGPPVGSTGRGITDWKVEGLHLVSGLFPYTTAAGTGLEVVSASHGEADVFCTEFKTQSVLVHTQAGLTESQNAEKNRISVRARQINTTGCILRLNGTGTTNACFNDFPIVSGEFSGTIAVDLHDCDNNEFHRIFAQPVGSTGNDAVVVFNAGLPGAQGPAHARNNTIRHLSGSITRPLVYALGTETAQIASGPNRIEQIDEANAFPDVRVGTGVSLFWGSNLQPTGVRSENRTVTGGYTIWESGKVEAWATTGALPANTPVQISFPAGIFTQAPHFISASPYGGVFSRYLLGGQTKDGFQITVEGSDFWQWKAEGY